MVRIVGMKIRKLREEMGLTQEDLAKSVGLSSEFISLLELGRRSPSLESLSRIAKFLDKEISFFILEKTESFDSLIQGDKLDTKTRRLLRKFRSYCDDYLQLEEMTGRQSDLAPHYANVEPKNWQSRKDPVWTWEMILSPMFFLFWSRVGSISSGTPSLRISVLPACLCFLSKNKRLLLCSTATSRSTSKS